MILSIPSYTTPVRNCCFGPYSNISDTFCRRAHLVRISQTTQTLVLVSLLAARSEAMFAQAPGRTHPTLQEGSSTFEVGLTESGKVSTHFRAVLTNFGVVSEVRLALTDSLGRLRLILAWVGGVPSPAAGLARDLHNRLPRQKRSRIRRIGSDRLGD